VEGERSVPSAIYITSTIVTAGTFDKSSTPPLILSLRSILILSSPLGHFSQICPVPMSKSSNVAERTPAVSGDCECASRPALAFLPLTLFVQGLAYMQHAVRLNKRLCEVPPCAKTLKHWVLVGRDAWYRSSPTLNIYKEPHPEVWTRRQTCLLRPSWPNRWPNRDTLHLLDQIAYNIQHKHKTYS